MGVLYVGIRYEFDDLQQRFDNLLNDCKMCSAKPFEDFQMELRYFNHKLYIYILLSL